jgi:hypothetical protein
MFVYKFGTVSKNDPSGACHPIGSLILKNVTREQAFMLALRQFHFDSARYALKLYEID